MSFFADYPLTSFATGLSLLQYQAFSLIVGRARKQYNVKAPATTGDVEFEKRYRVQMNTLEQLPIFMGSMWLFASYYGDTWAGALGLTYFVGRILFALGYYSDPSKRGVGMMINFFSSTAMLGGSLYASGLHVIQRFLE
eukprot:gb/GECH01003471.1/.p1 GENE.gb/GECH01003471.1/~~gb/GECH01003471.1/.p1  ORF type:complete len:139 (+),score=28.38 gb/GECH01003471.1/:1-417(+)